MNKRHSALFVTTVASTLRAFLIPFARDLRAHGWRVDALAAGATAEPGLREAFVTLTNAPWSRNPLWRGNRGPSVRRVRDLVSRGRYDVVHVHTPIAAFVTRYALRRMVERPVVIYTAHGFHFYRGARSLTALVYRMLERRAAAWTDFIVTLNQEDFEAASRFRGIAQDRVRLIPGVGVELEFYGAPVDDDAIEHVRREFRLRPDAFVLTMVAEFGAVKRHAFLLEALARVKDPRVVVVLVGAGPLEAELRAKAARLGVDRRIRWAGYRDDVREIIAASDAMLLVSEREGLPRSLLEGMAAGKPIVGTETRGIADLALPDAGWVAPRHDAAALASAIEHAANHPEEVAAKGLAARARVEQQYALPLILDAYRELYDDALASRV